MMIFNLLVELSTLVELLFTQLSAFAQWWGSFLLLLCCCAHLSAVVERCLLASSFTRVTQQFGLFWYTHTQTNLLMTDADVC